MHKRLSRHHDCVEAQLIVVVGAQRVIAGARDELELPAEQLLEALLERQADILLDVDTGEGDTGQLAPWIGVALELDLADLDGDAFETLQALDGIVVRVRSDKHRLHQQLQRALECFVVFARVLGMVCSPLDFHVLPLFGCMRADDYYLLGGSSGSMQYL